MTGALYITDGGRLVPSDLVTSPWSEDISHAGPPAALLVRAIQGTDPDDLALVRITIEILRPIPVAPLKVTTTVLKPGPRARLTGATLSDDGETVLARASAWQLRERDPFPVPRDAPSTGNLAPPDTGTLEQHRFAPWVHFPTDAQELRTVSGSIAAPGPAAVWFRFLVPIVAGEEPTPEQRFAATADSANGISGYASMREMVFINTDLSVYFARRPGGVWVGLDARSSWEPSGRGLSDSALFDADGYVGRSNQVLFIEPPGP